MEDLRLRVLAGRIRLEERWFARAVAVVAHLYPIRALVAEASGQGLEAWESIRIPTGSITLMERTAQGWRLDLLGWKPAEGQVRVLGTDVATASEQELEELYKKVGIVYQSGALYGSLTVAENVGLPLAEHSDLDEKIIFETPYQNRWAAALAVLGIDPMRIVSSAIAEA